MKGLILAGGSGTRLYPTTRAISKQLLPIYDKPMIYYSLSVLMLAGIKDILIITTPEDQTNYKRLLNDGRQFGINLSYSIQIKPGGVAEAFIVGEEFIGKDSVCLILGDNIFYGQGLTTLLEKAILKHNGATIFGYKVNDPERFGVIEINEKGKIISLKEKPKNPRSDIAITGLYFYDNDVIKYAKSLKPSSRGEIDITSINQIYLKKKNLNLEVLKRGFAWLDTGTYSSIIDASKFVETIENRQGYKIACLEEIALNKKWINIDTIKKSNFLLYDNPYSRYLLSLIENKS
jgi:glucose-1-phosphate thymidylyltransferase